MDFLLVLAFNMVNAIQMPTVNWRRMAFVRTLFLLLCIVLTIPAKAQPLKIATILGAPWGFMDAHGKPAGIMYDIGNRIAEEAGLPYSNSLVPYARTAVDIETGQADLLLRFGNEHLANVAVPVTAVVAMPVIAVGPKGSSFAELQALRGKMVGVVRTSKYVDAFDNDATIGKYPVNDYVIMAKMVAARRLDAGVGSDVGFYYGAFAAGVKPEQLGPPLVLGKNEFVLFYSKRSAKPDRIKALREAVGRLHASGEIKRIVERYTSDFAAFWALK